MAKLKRFGVSIPAELVDAFDRLIEAKGYPNRSEAIRDLMRDALVESEWESDAGEVVGTVTIVYHHEARDLSRKMTQMQHEAGDVVICTTHVHLDEHNCMEVVVVRGSAAQVRAIADKLISMKGVKHGKLVCTTTGKSLA
ncbi:MAG: nickel-responsive transcriptional regulator NikR [Armatimonadota bacterium]|nr:nickel-responsive transcriptional regulator NikR [bacterium]MDW8320035.1 nickel-responsive transcriptional regulator NikR [Armatimonadota bacterium]